MRKLFLDFNDAAAMASASSSTPMDAVVAAEDGGEDAATFLQKFFINKVH